MAMKLSNLRAGHHLHPGRYLVLISVQSLSRPEDHCAVERLRSRAKSSDFVGNGTCDVPACSSVPETTASASTYPYNTSLYYGIYKLLKFVSVKS
jgi:hypothetical protein